MLAQTRIGNTIAKKDAKENVYPRKAREENKIDGTVALIMAVGRAMVRVSGYRPSIFDAGPVVL